MHPSTEKDFPSLKLAVTSPLKIRQFDCPQKAASNSNPSIFRFPLAVSLAANWTLLPFFVYEKLLLSSALNTPSKVFHEWEAENHHDGFGFENHRGNHGVSSSSKIPREFVDRWIFQVFHQPSRGKSFRISRQMEGPFPGQCGCCGVAQSRRGWWVGASHFWGNQTWGNKKSSSRWWFHIFFIVTPIWGSFPFWQIFLKGVETTN